MNSDICWETLRTRCVSSQFRAFRTRSSDRFEKNQIIKIYSASALLNTRSRTVPGLERGQCCDLQGVNVANCDSADDEPVTFALIRFHLLEKKYASAQQPRLQSLIKYIARKLLPPKEAKFQHVSQIKKKTSGKLRVSRRPEAPAASAANRNFRHGSVLSNQLPNKTISILTS